MSEFEKYKWAKCPIPNCGEDLIMVLSTPVYVDDRPLTSVVDTLDYSEWETGCANGHIVDSGAPDHDGRSPVHGYRNAQSLGGLR